MAFYGWLQRQTLLGKVSPSVEKLALDIWRDSAFPRNSSDYGEIREHLAINGHFSEAVEPFREAWNGFAQARDVQLPREIETG